MKIKYYFGRLSAFLDRKYNLIFNRKSCVRLTLTDANIFYYNDIITTGGEATNLRCLGNDWYLTLKNKQ